MADATELKEAIHEIFGSFVGDVFAENPRVPANIGDVLNAVQFIDGDVASVKTAIKLLYDRGLSVSRDTLKVASAVAVMNLDRASDLKTESVIAVLFMGALTRPDSTLSRNQIEPEEIASDLQVGVPNDEVVQLASELARILRLPVTFHTGKDKGYALTQEELAENQDQFMHVQNMIAKMDERVLAIMAPVWVQRLRRYMREIDAAANNPEQRAKILEEAIYAAIAVEGYGLPYIRELGWPELLVEAKDLIIRIVDPEAHFRFTNALPDAHDVQLLKKEIETSYRRQLAVRLAADPRFKGISEQDIIVDFRVKDPYSIWEKIILKIYNGGAGPFKAVLSEEDYARYDELVGDIFAMRIIIPDVHKRGRIDQEANEIRCIALKQIMHSMGARVDGMQRNYYDHKEHPLDKRISNYRGIHTGIRSRGRKIEVQICTAFMAAYNQIGLVRHSFYKNRTLRFLSELMGSLAKIRYLASADIVNNEQLTLSHDASVRNVLERLWYRLRGHPLLRLPESTITISDRDQNLQHIPRGTKFWQLAAYFHSRIPGATYKILYNGRRFVPKPLSDIWQREFQDGDHIRFVTSPADGSGYSWGHQPTPLRPEMEICLLNGFLDSLPPEIRNRRSPLNSDDFMTAAIANVRARRTYLRNPPKRKTKAPCPAGL
jgi:(p)ppGpp synthase/HD superfamily hydrolase